MSTPSPRTYPDWKAPAEDGQTLIWPDAEQVLTDTRENAPRLSSAQDVRIQNVPLAELRRRVRHWIGHTDDAQPLIATGHQTELYHPGVWSKNALIDAVAKRLGGQAYHFAVDTDEPKHLHLRWPGGSEPITDDPALGTAAWSGMLHPPTPAHVTHVQRVLERAAQSWSFQPVAFEVLASMRRLALESERLSLSLTNATHELDWNLGLRHHALVVSPIWHSEPYLVFVHHMMRHAAALAAGYNASLAEYRALNKIKNPGRPMPDLRVSDDEIETPFWIDDLTTGTRRRGSVRRQGVRLLVGGAEPFDLDASKDGWTAANELLQWLRRHNLRLSPRAITLTLFLRMLAADQFVHGIGGGRYDQVTDRFIERFFDFEAPKFAVTTATMYFPEAVGRSRSCLPCIALEGHRLRHRVLGDRKMELVTQIDGLPRRSRERGEVFRMMHKELATAATGSPALREWEQQLQQAQDHARGDEMLFDRELFYAIQPRERLESTIAKYAAVFS